MYIKKAQNDEYHVPEESREEMDVEKSKPVTKTEIEYILKTCLIVSEITVINKVNIEIYHRIAMSNIKLDVEVEMKTMMTQRPQRVDVIQIRSKKIEFQLELRKRFETLQELDDIDTMSETITYNIQQSASRVAKTIDKPLKSRISSPT